MSFPDSANFKKPLSMFLGPAVFLIVLLLPGASGLSFQGQAVLAVVAWVAIWWVSEAIPIPATSLLPIVLFPLLNILSVGKITAAYGHPMVFLYMGGFVLALAIEKWNLHLRIALHTIALIGRKPPQIIFGFMLATFILSMWISNTATTMLMLPIAVAVAGKFGTSPKHDDDPLKPIPIKMSATFGLPLMLGIAYASSIGGIATLIGTPTNAMFSAVVGQLFSQQIDFALWMMLALPLSIVLLLICWLYLVKLAFPVSKSFASVGGVHIQEELEALGPISKDEKKVLVVFGLTAFSWISRSFLLNRFIPGIDDTVIAIAASVVLFLIPSSKKGKQIMDWKTAKKLPWGILILFGGGLALAEGFQSSGLAAWLGESLKLLSGVNFVILLFAVSAMVNFLTEVTSNVATASILLPILASIAIAIGVHPFPLMVAATLSASCAFMLPVATPPNAIVFGSGYVKIGQMVRAGFILNIISIVLVVLVVWLLMPIIWDLDPNVLPAFAE